MEQVESYWSPGLLHPHVGGGAGEVLTILGSPWNCHGARRNYFYYVSGGGVVWILLC